MEHLQLVEGARQPSLAIPLVFKSASEFPYTFGPDDFIDFPNNHLREIRFIHPNISVSDAFSSLVQSWLFFGTLSQFFKRSVNIESFTQLNATGGRVLCTSVLGDLRAAWIASLPRRSYFTAALRQLESRRCAVLLARATFVYSRIEDLAIDDAPLQRVLFSVKLMLSSLCQTVRVVLGPTPTLDAILTRLAFRPAAKDWSSKSDFLLWDYMVENGWCPHQINTLLGVYTPTAMVYLASMRRKRRQADHRDCLEAGYCKASQIDWAHFQTPHVSTGCTCAHVAVDEQRMMEKLEDGQIPLLSCTRDLSGNFSVEITHVDMQRAFGARTPYFAISHVWADGLGNPHANSLPKCQFEKLYDKLMALSTSAATMGPLTRLFQHRETGNGETPIVFWMDVFCIPVQKPNSPRHADLKDQAIALMDLTYSCASQVLVLDSEIEYVAANRGGGDDLTSSTEALARFATSKWMGRSWTLQEGALAAALWTYYSGSPARHKAFHAFHVPSYLADESPPEALAIIEELQNQASLPFVGRGARDMTNAAMYCHTEREVQFLEVWNSLIGRSTTQPEDFHCIVANLLDFSVQELAKLKDPLKSDEHNRYARITAIILAQKRLPMQLFCLPQSSRPYPTNGMRWLPERPIEPRLSEDAFTHAVKVTDDGFVMEPPCLTSCFFAWPAQGTIGDFCINLPTNGSAHPRISLQLEQPTDVAGADLLIYLNASPKAHSLQSDYRRTGVAFVVTEQQAASATVRYSCPLTFHHCWKSHGRSDSRDCIPGSAIKNGTTIRISGPNTHKALKFRRPLRFGSGLVATIPSRFTLAVLLFSFGGGLLLLLLLFLPLVRNRILDNPVAAPLLPMLYFCLTTMLLFYLVVVVFVCARHLSAPWVRETFLTDQMPWYIGALYSDKLLTDSKVVMAVKRFCNALLTRFVYKHAPYEIRGDSPNERRMGLRLARLAPPWGGRPLAASTEQDYTDDHDSNIPLLPTGESDSRFLDYPPLSSRSPGLDADETDAFDCISRENAVRLRLIQRALIETRGEDTGRGVWDGIAAMLVAGMWLGRVDSRRGVLDLLYDVGIPLRRRDPGNGEG